MSNMSVKSSTSYDYLILFTGYRLPDDSGDFMEV